jgi:hypothetical protein
MMTSDESAEFARKLRHAADQADRLALLQRWVSQCRPDNAMCDVRVTWGLGTSVQGYDDLSKIVSKMIAPMIPDLIRKAISEVETNVHIARRDLPAPPGPK